MSWGNYCNQTCGHCKNNTCIQSNGTCIGKCEVGYWGARCLDTCLYDGCAACERWSGECSLCKPGLWGDNCSTECSSACPAAEDGQIYCNKLTGACDVGACDVGFYGKDCTAQCSKQCASNVCDFDTGKCTIYCISGWWGDYCNQTCSSTCIGQECRRDGECDERLGCVDGYSGFYCSTPCDYTCIDGRCDRDMAVCLECLRLPVKEQNYTCRTAGIQRSSTTVDIAVYVYTCILIVFAALVSLLDKLYFC